MELSFVVEPGGGELGEPVVSPEVWEDFNAGATWCSLTDLTGDGRMLRVAIAPPHGVLERGSDRRLVPSFAAPALFWTASGVSSYAPHASHELHPAWRPTVEAWLDGADPPTGELPASALRLRLGQGEDVLRDEILFIQTGAWMRARRLLDQLLIDEFSMRQLLLDLSMALAEHALHGVRE